MIEDSGERLILVFTSTLRAGSGLKTLAIRDSWAEMLTFRLVSC